MDVDKIIKDEKKKQETERILNSAELKRLKIRKTETENFKDQFRKFFRDVYHFSCPKDCEPVVATYDSVVVTLAENVERNEQEKGYTIYFTLTSPDKSVHSIFAEGVAYRLGAVGEDEVLISESELTEANLKFLEDVIHRRVFYKFKYKIEEDEREFGTVRGLMEVV